ncbi:predicted protein [Naegleria gruberi]|uniref:Predicted protein n=1 Tax=Naegleria gruberi TaxID=5762 RepID=D2VH56_NAEGR|nr:uncharacterized protein NAEGRDRAFT_68282 [Naegleria gruberi]EFC43835.1 predicted protein [Naegleria gruberi]|eukprot:XP_002676579.1 predicted protein [Naegleria gruberi strain NEG-M]
MIRQNKPKEFYKLLFYHAVQTNFKYSAAISYLKQLIKLLNNNTIFTKPTTPSKSAPSENDVFDQTMNLEKIIYLNRNITFDFKVKNLNFLNSIVYFLFLNYYSKTALILFLEAIMESIEKHKHTSVDYLIIGQGLRTNYQNKKAKYYFKLSHQLDKLNFILYLYLSNVNRSKGYSIYQNRYIELGLFKISQEIRLIEQYKNSGDYLQNYIINQYEKQLNEIYNILYLNKCVNLKTEPLSKVMEISHKLVFQSNDSYLAWFYIAFFYGFEIWDLIKPTDGHDDIKDVPLTDGNVTLKGISDIQNISEIYEISLYYFRKSFKHLYYPHADIYLPLIFENIGMIYENDDNFEKAAKYYNSACVIGEQTQHYWAFSSRLSFNIYRINNFAHAYYDATNRRHVICISSLT